MNEQTDRSIAWAVLCVILVGAAVRFLGLSEQSFWIDEIFSAQFAIKPFMGEAFLEQLRGDVHPPLYSLFIGFWGGHFGTGEAALRFPSALFGVASVVFLYVLNKQNAGAFAACCAAVILAFSGFAIFKSQEVRSYSLLLMMATIATSVWLQLVKGIAIGKALSSKLIIFGVVSCLTALTHYVGMLAVAVQYAYLFIQMALSRKYSQSLLVVIVGLLALSLPLGWIVYSLPYFSHFMGGNHWIPSPTVLDYLSIARALFGQPVWLLLFAIPLMSDMTTIRTSITRALANDRNMSVEFPLLVFIVGVFVLATLVSFHTPLIANKNFVVIFPAVYLLVGRFLSYGVKVRQLWGPWFVFATSFAALITFLVSAYPLKQESFYDPYKEQYREAVALMAGTAKPGDFVLFDNAFLQWYLDKQFSQESVVQLPATEFDQLQMFERFVQHERGGTESLFIVGAHKNTFSDAGLSYLNENFVCVNITTFNQAWLIEAHSVVSRCRSVDWELEDAL